MKLPGRLGPATLGDVLGALHRDGASGVLELVESQGTSCGRVHRVHLLRGLVQHVQSSLSVPKLGELLQTRGFLPVAARSKFVRALMSPSAGKSGAVLSQEAGVPESAVVAALRHQLQLKLGELFGLRSPDLRFRVAQRPPEEPLAAIPLSPREFLHGRSRARDLKTQQEPSTLGTSRRERTLAVRHRALGVLGLAETASRADIQRAFRTLARQFHPDSHPAASPGQRVELLRQFSELSAAYHQLCA